MILKARFSKLFFIFVLMLGLACMLVYPVSAASTATAYDVYVSGNYVMGETLTAHYTYYDPSGLPEVTENVKYQWYRRNKFGKSGGGDAVPMKIADATLPTYTLTDKDVGTSGSEVIVYVQVTTANENGSGTGVYSEYLSGAFANGASNEPKATGAYIEPQNPEGSMLMGDTLVAHFSYQQPDGTPEGDSLYEWQTRNTLTDEPSVVQAASTNNTYTLQPEDFGKVIECVITPVNADGGSGTPITAKNHYGNLFFKQEAEITTSSTFYAANISKIDIIRDGGGDRWMTSSTDKVSEIVVDVGSVGTFDGIYLKINASNSIMIEEISYSTDGETYTNIDTTNVDISGSGIKEVEIDLGKSTDARYFKMKISKAKAVYTSLFAFYPYTSASVLPKLTLLGSDSIELYRSQSYEEPGYTAYSSTGEDLSGQVAIEGTVNSNELGEYPIEYSLSVDGFPTVRASRLVTVREGIQSPGDLAFGKSVTADSGSNPEYLCDGNPYTVWTLDRATGSATIDLGSVQGIAKILIHEEGEKVNSYTVSASADGEKWTELLEGTNITGELCDFAPIEARYVRLQINDASANPTIGTAELYFTKAAEVYLAREKLTLGDDLSDVTEDLALPAKGAYDVDITWSSSNPDVISTEGAVKRGSSDVTVILTATLSNEADSLDKSFEVTVTKKEKSSSGSGGGNRGGSSGSSGGKSTTVSMPVLPKAPTTLPTVSEPKVKFTDVAAGHWAAQYINALAADGVISGRSETEFDPDGNITRAEFLKLLFAIFDLKAETIDTYFTDVSADDWYYSYVAGGAALGIVSGRGDGTFAPNESILRRDVAVMVDKALNVVGLSLAQADSTAALSDYDAIADYAKDAVSKLTRGGIISGNENGEFMPGESVTRAQAAKIIYLLRDALERGVGDK